MNNQDVIPVPPYVSPLAVVDETSSLAAGVKVWHFSQIREGVVLGENCIVSKDVYIGPGVKIGANSKIQNAVILCYKYEYLLLYYNKDEITKY